MAIRHMQITDYKEVYALWQSTPGMGLNNVDDTQAGIARFLQRNPNTCFVDEQNGKVMAVILTGHDGRRGYIYHLAVAKQAQRQGLGTALLNRAMEALQAEGIVKAGLLVFANNGKGNAFWTKQGFADREDVVYRNKMLTEMQYTNPKA